MDRKKNNPLARVLARHGVSDAESFINGFDEGAKIGQSRDPEVRLRGSIQLMKNRKISREDVAKGMARLKRF